jgi:hypothetical protein
MLFNLTLVGESKAQAIPRVKMALNNSPALLTQPVDLSWASRSFNWAALDEEKIILTALSKRMNYFDGLVNVAKTLTRQATGLMETTKSFRSKLSSTRDELMQDYRPEDIDENLGDVDFANDFAETLFGTLNNLQKECDKVMADCLKRKHAIDDALIGLNKEEEVVELNAADSKLS